MIQLKEKKIWILWNYQTTKSGKATKVPISATGNRTGTSSDYSSTWVTYDEAVEAQARLKADGVGFVIPDGYFFLDIDHKEVDAPLSQKMLARFNSYAEISPSGNGLHIYGMCDLAKMPLMDNGKIEKEFYQKNSKLGLELYIGGATNRFATFTGNAISDTPLAECTTAVLETFDKEMRRADKRPQANMRRKLAGSSTSSPHSKMIGDAANIVASLRKQKNGAKFIRLFDNGDISGYGSHSEADLALCTLIAYRAGNDAALIDDIFRSSALYRDKWEREDYRTATIQMAITNCSGSFYEPKNASCVQYSADAKTRPEFIIVNEKTGKERIDAPLLAKHVRENLDYLLVRDNGKQAILKYVYDKGCYRLYADEMIRGIIKKFIADYDERLVRMSILNEVLGLLTTDLNYISMDKLNTDEGIINFTNGLLKVTGDSVQLVPHNPDVLSTIQIPCRWTGCDTSTPVFDSYIRTLADNDEDVIELIMETVGVAISNVKGYRMKKSVFYVGDGNTGKSQLKSLVERLLGKGNFISIDLREIESRFGTGTIYGTRLAGSSDMSFMSINELKTFKKLTGGDSLFAEFKGQQAFEFVYDGFLWFCMNRLPKFGGDDGKWIYDRIIVIKCPNVIPNEKQDKLLLEKMYAERDGIVYKAVKALQRVIANGYRFTEPKSISDNRTEYARTNSTVISFFEECMEYKCYVKPADRFTVGQIYDAYKAWCINNNHGFAKTQREFRDDLCEYLGMTYTAITQHTKRGTSYINYTLTKEASLYYNKFITTIYDTNTDYDDDDFLN